MFRPFPLSEELKQAPVTRTLRGLDGRLWVGTQDGLYVYDGSDLAVYGQASRGRFYLADSHIINLAMDKQGTIYASLFAGGIAKLHPDGLEFERIDLNTEHENVTFWKMVFSGDDILWLSSNKHMLTYDPRKAAKSRWEIRRSITGVLGQPIDIQLTSGNKILILGTSAVLEKDSSSDDWMKLEPLTPPKENNLVPTAVYKSKHDGYYIGYNTGLVRSLSTSDKAQTSVTYEGYIGSGGINEISEIGDAIIFATDLGLYRSNNSLTKIEKILGPPNTPTSIAIDDLFLDDDMIWIGTLKGLHTFSFSDFGTESRFENEKSSIVYAITQSNNDLWVGTYDGLYRYNANSRSKSHYSFDSPALALKKGVSSLATYGGKVFVGLYKDGIRIYDQTLENPVFETVTGLESQTVTSMATDSDTGNIWIATYDEGLFRLNHNGLESLLASGKLPLNSVTLVHLTAHSAELYVASFDKLYRYSETSNSFDRIQLDFGDGKKDAIIYSLGESVDGDLWIGTKSQGLFRLPKIQRHQSNPKLIEIAAGGILRHSTIYGFAQDDSRNLWCSTQNGIFRYNRDDYSMDWFTTADGLQWSDFSLGAAFRDSRGIIFFGGSGGLVYFDPNTVGAMKTPLNTVINRLVLGESPITITTGDLLTRVVASYSDRYVSMGFSSLDFTEPNRIQYRYKLENFDEDWIDSGSQNSATYTNLPSGDYTFRVQAANSSGIWSPEGASLALTVLPPPWLTWWAYCIYALAAGALLWGFHRIYYSFVIDRKATELAFEMHLAEERADDDMQGQIELQQDLVQSAYEHNKTTLALIANFLELRARGENGQDARSKLSHQARLATLSNLEECLYFQAGGSVIDMYKLTEAIFEEVLPQAAVEPTTIITINEVTKELIPASIASPVSIIICELVENALIHAFDTGSPANYIHVAFSRSPHGDEAGDYWLLEVSDNGKGLEAREPSDKIKEGYGLRIVHALAEELGAKLTIKQREGAFISIQIPATLSTRSFA